MVHSISVCFMIYIYYPKCNNMFFWQEWSMINIGGLRRILMDIDGLRWFSGVSAKKLSVLTFWATWPCLKFSSPAGPASFGKKGLCWNCPWAYHNCRVSRGVEFCAWDPSVTHRIVQGRWCFIIAAAMSAMRTAAGLCALIGKAQRLYFQQTTSYDDMIVIDSLNVISLTNDTVFAHSL